MVCRGLVVPLMFVLVSSSPALGQEGTEQQEAVRPAEKTETEAAEQVDELRENAEASDKQVDELRESADAAEAQVRELLEAAKETENEIEELQRLMRQQGEDLHTQERRVARSDSLLAAQRARIKELEKVSEDRRQELEKQDELLHADHDRIDKLNELVLSLNNRLLELEDQAPVDSLSQLMAERLQRLEASLQEVPEVPPDIVSAGDFPGSFQVPGTGAALKIGGWVRASIVSTWDALGSEDRFITATIPVEGSDDAAKGARLSISAAASRFNFDFRTPTGVGNMRAFIEGDFGGVGNTFRLRHAYGQYRRLLVGQTWSVMMDVRANPEDIDFEGLNARIQFRHPQVRFFKRLGDELNVAASAEDAQPDIQTTAPDSLDVEVQGISQIPDFAGRLVWTRETFHIQVGAVLRQLRGSKGPGDVVGILGWGAMASGKVVVPWLNDKDSAILAVNGGHGLGRYITDLRSEGGQDAVYDAVAGQLHALPVITGYVALHHYWRDNVHSTAVYGLVYVDNLDVQLPDSYNRTQRFTFNIVYTPVSHLDIGAEFIYGTRRNKDFAKGSARQLQMAATYRF